MRSIRMLSWFGYHYPPVSAREVAQELYVTSVGRIAHSAGEAYPPVGHPPEYAFRWDEGRILGDFTMIWLESGSGYVETRNLGSFELKTGLCLFLPPGAWHRYRPDPVTGWIERWVCLNGGFLHRLTNNAVFPAVSALRSIRREGDLEICFEALCRSAAEDGLADAALGLAMVAAMMDAGLEQAPEKQAHSVDGLVHAAVDFIRMHCHRRLGVADVARCMGVSRRALERRFAASWAHGVAEEITVARVERGRSLLIDSGMSVKEAGYAAGFGGSRRFIESHVRLHGITPGRLKPGSGKLKDDCGDLKPA
jgi:AraC-like DNA-binding protein